MKLALHPLGGVTVPTPEIEIETIQTKGKVSNTYSLLFSLVL